MSLFFFFFFNDTATTEIYTLSLHDALPISGDEHVARGLDVEPGQQHDQDAHDVVVRFVPERAHVVDRKSTRLNSSHGYISYAVFCLKKKKKKMTHRARPVYSSHATRRRSAA